MGQLLVQEGKVPGVQHIASTWNGSLGEGHCPGGEGAPCFSQNFGTIGSPGAGAGQGVAGAEPSASLMPV